MSDWRSKHVVKPGEKIRLKDIDPEEHGKHASRDEATPDLQRELATMEELQYKLYAERKQSLLIILQGMDASGKDGVVRHVLTGMNPLGVRLHAFKQPTPEELSRDFLWRIHQRVPGKGEVAIFNRSHYEDVLVVRVHELVKEKVWSRRYDIINEFERLLGSESKMRVLKFFLHISKEEQLKRFYDRLNDPTCNWKIAESDYSEREKWDDYQAAYEDALSKCSTDHSPWHVIPANRKWYRNLAIAKIINETLKEMNPGLPPVTVDIAEITRHYHAAKAKQAKENGEPVEEAKPLEGALASEKNGSESDKKKKKKKKDKDKQKSKAKDKPDETE